MITMLMNAVKTVLHLAAMFRPPSVCVVTVRIPPGRCSWRRGPGTRGGADYAGTSTARPAIRPAFSFSYTATASPRGKVVVSA